MSRRDGGIWSSVEGRRHWCSIDGSMIPYLALITLIISDLTIWHYTVCCNLIVRDASSLLLQFLETQYPIRQTFSQHNHNSSVLSPFSLVCADCRLTLLCWLLPFPLLLPQLCCSQNSVIWILLNQSMIIEYTVHMYIYIFFFSLRFSSIVLLEIKI